MDELYHYGVKGMKWGVRRYQKKDGSLTSLGKKHRQHALYDNDQDKKVYDKRKHESKKDLDSVIKRKTNQMLIENDAQEPAKKFLEWSSKSKAHELLEKAYKDGTMQVGSDYVWDKKHRKIEFTESGMRKRKDIIDKADSITKKDNEQIIKKYIDGPKKKEEQIQRSHDKGYETAQKIRDDIKRKTYKNESERNAAIDKAFRKAMEEADRSGDRILGDELQQQWGFVYDDMKVGRY